MENRTLRVDFGNNLLPGENIAAAAIKRRMAGKRRAFTLVEVIVVLVILAILAAIAIPALTGYIDKAEDKKYIAEARDIATALRTMLDEDLAFGNLIGNFPEAEKYRLTDGDSTYTNSNLKRYNLVWIGVYATGSNDNYIYYKEAAKLIGRSFAESEKGAWDVFLLAPRTSNGDDYDVFNAPAYIYYNYRPDGDVNSKTAIVVSQGIAGISPSVKSFTAFSSEMTTTAYYDPDAGYKVYRLSF